MLCLDTQHEATCDDLYRLFQTFVMISMPRNSEIGGIFFEKVLFHDLLMFVSLPAFRGRPASLSMEPPTCSQKTKNRFKAKKKCREQEKHRILWRQSADGQIAPKVG